MENNKDMNFSPSESEDWTSKRWNANELNELRKLAESQFLKNDQRKYKFQSPLTLQRQQAQEIWACYAVASERLDQEVCSGTERGVAIPMNSYERSLINRHALHLRSIAKKLALELKIPNTILQETRDFMEQRYKDLEQVADSSSFYSAFHQESIQWQTSNK